MKKKAKESDNIRPVVALLYQFLVILINYLFFLFVDDIVLVDNIVEYTLLSSAIIMLFPIFYFKVGNERIKLRRVITLILITFLFSMFLELSFYNLNGNFQFQLDFQNFKPSILIYTVNNFIYSTIMPVIVFFYYINDIHIYDQKKKYIYLTISIILYALFFMPYFKLIIAGLIIGSLLSYLYIKYKNIYLIIGLDLLIFLITNVVKSFR